MLEVQLVWGEAAQQAALLPLLLQEAKGKVPAGRGHLDPAGKGSSSSSSPSKALGLGQSCRKAPACGVPSPGGFRGAASLERYTDPRGHFLHPLQFCDFWEPQKCWDVMKLELQGERGS